MSRYRWQVFPPISAALSAGHPEISPLLLQLLHNRGITDPARYQDFLGGNEGLVGDPFLIPDMAQAVGRVYRALLSGENIAIYGDFDTDGVTATVLLVQGLSRFGANVVPYIPHRTEEGYGLNKPALDRLRRDGISLVISADCGITAVPEVAHARRIGLDVIVTDHHSVTTALPKAEAVVNPKRPDSTYPFRELSGVGVAFKLLQALSMALGRDAKMTAEFLDLVALGTVADMSPLVGENRYLVKEGLQVLNRTNRLGLQEMALQAGLKPGSLDAESISFVLAPRLNTAGRLDHAISSYRLLVTEKAEEARQLAGLLQQKNVERQQLTADTLVKAKERLSKTDTGQPLLMVGADDYPAGIIGLVASRLVDEFCRPVMVIRLGPEMCRGSARSIPQFNMVAALTECSDLLTQFGGHSQAAGFTLPSANVERFYDRLLTIASRELAGIEFRRVLPIDASVGLSSMEGDTLKLLNTMAPFGQGNPAPTFVSRRVKLLDWRKVGNNGPHLKLRLSQDKTVWPCIAFQMGGMANQLSPYLDIVYNLEMDDWGNTPTLRLNLLDFAPSEPAG
ncbi:MAG: single-stranded-DNA-specific exonuclease RecJ [Dehalococcoidia bacterium]|nr:single-stranded-DNA-specific exonuclease RecJ [Dehalococcoidia bacterium]